MSFESLRYESPRSSRFFDQSSLPDLKNYVHIQSSNGGRQTVINNQLTNVNYNPYSYPQQKTKLNLPVDFFHLQNKIAIELLSQEVDHPKSNEIPSIELTHEQFADPIKFIDSISEIGKKYGAVKVIPPKSMAPVLPLQSQAAAPNTPSSSSNVAVPPAAPTSSPSPSTSANSSASNFEETSFKSNFQINADLFWFQTNRLLNNPDGDELDNRLKFHQELIKFHLLHLKSETSSQNESSASAKNEQDSEVQRLPQPPREVGGDDRMDLDTSVKPEHSNPMIPPSIVKQEVVEKVLDISENAVAPINGTSVAQSSSEVNNNNNTECKTKALPAPIPESLAGSAPEIEKSVEITREEQGVNGTEVAKSAQEHGPDVISTNTEDSEPTPRNIAEKNSKELEDKLTKKDPTSSKEKSSEPSGKNSPKINGSFEEELITPTPESAIQTRGSHLTETTNPLQSTQLPKSKKNQLPSFLNKLPMIDKRPLDLYKLFRSVLIRGGFIEVINKKLWAQIGRELGYRGKIMTSLSSSLKSSYMKILYPFETYLAGKKLKRDEGTAMTDSVDRKRKFSAVSPLILGSLKTFKRSVRLKVEKGFLLNSPHLTDIKQPNTISSRRLAPEDDPVVPSSPGIGSLPLVNSDTSLGSGQSNNRRKRPKPAPNSNSEQFIPITAQAQLNQSLQALLENSGIQDALQTTSNGKFSSVYTLRQFMEKDLKFQEFLIQKNFSSFNKIPSKGSSSVAGNSSNPASPSSISNSKFSYFNIREEREANSFENEGKFMSPTTLSNSVSSEKSAISIEKLEEMYWKFVSNSPSEANDFLLLLEGLELENGVCLPSFVNGSGFVRLGDDLLNYKNILASVTQNSTSQVPLSNSSIPSTTASNSNASASAASSNSAGNSLLQQEIKANPTPPSTSSSFDGSYYNSSDYCVKMIKSSLSPWNLHNLPILPNSLFGVLGSEDVNNQDLYTPTLNIGMTFTTENWRAEDHFTQLINYQFFGGHKKWYFIPELEFENFEKLLTEINSKETRIHVNNNKWDYDNLMKYFSGLADCNNIESEALISSLENMIPPYLERIRLKHVNEKFQELIDIQSKKRSQNSLIMNQDCLISPLILDQHGIKYNYAVQKPGEFIIRFPKTYSSTISFGLNLSEEVNFATSNWLNYALEGEKWINKQLLLPNFLTFKMLVNLAQLQESHHRAQQVYLDLDVYSKALEIFGKLYTEEIELREKVRNSTKNIKELVDEKLFVAGESISDDDLQNVFPSKIQISSSTESMTLSLSNFLEYGDLLNDLKVELHLFCSDDKLRHFDKILREYSVDFGSWTIKYEEAMEENVLLPIKSLKGLLVEGEKILSATSAAFFNKAGDKNSPDYIKFVGYVENLRSFVETANVFVEECQKVLSVKHQQRIRGKKSNNASLHYESERAQSDETLEILIRLLDKIPTLNFVCPEADQILELKTEIENFERASRTFLTSSSKYSIQEFDDLISLGESFGVNLPTLSFLKRLRGRIIWMEHFGVLKSGGDPIQRRGKENNKVFSIDDLKSFSIKGESILGENDLENYQEILKMITLSEQFDDDVSKFLSYRSISDISLDDFQQLLTKYETEAIFLNASNHEHLMKIREHLSLIERYLEFNLDVNEPKTKTYKVSEVNVLLTSLLESGLEFSLDVIKNELKKAETWSEQAFSKFASGNHFRTTIQKKKESSTLLKLNLNILLETFEKKNNFNFSLDEDKYHLSSSYIALLENEDGIPKEEENDENLPPIYCVCREPEAGTMIGCDICKEWFHIQCIKDPKSGDVEECDYYACPLCELTSTLEYVDDSLNCKIKLSELQSMITEGENLLVLPSDLNKVKDFATICIDASKEFSEIVEGIILANEIPSWQTLDKIRFFLRKAYGASINLDNFFNKTLPVVRDLIKKEQIRAQVKNSGKESQEPPLVEQHSNGKVAELKIDDESTALVISKPLEEGNNVGSISTKPLKEGNNVGSSSTTPNEMNSRERNENARNGESVDNHSIITSENNLHLNGEHKHKESGDEMALKADVNPSSNELKVFEEPTADVSEPIPNGKPVVDQVMEVNQSQSGSTEAGLQDSERMAPSLGTEKLDQPVHEPALDARPVVEIQGDSKSS